MSEISYDIVKKIGVIGESTKGWKKEFNLVSWNGREAKYDIRDWSEGNEKMGKGVTLSKDELGELKELLNAIDI
ncbi:MAG: YdbC family protein [Deltaproteobacteria bacterium]